MDLKRSPLVRATYRSLRHLQQEYLPVLETGMLNAYHQQAIRRHIEAGHKRSRTHDYTTIRNAVLGYLERTAFEHNGVRLYRFTEDSSEPDLYSTTWGYMIRGLLNDISEDEKEGAVRYFRNAQDPDGLFREDQLASPLAEHGDHWGWKHLFAHVIIAFGYLNAKPRYDPLTAAEAILAGPVEHWLSNLEWNRDCLTASNRIMNLGVMLQYSRDVFGNVRAGEIMRDMLDWLHDNNRGPNGLWGARSGDNIYRLSKAVKTTYHIVPLFRYDNASMGHEDAMVAAALRTQNATGGYGPGTLSDACEDIDSLYILAELSAQGAEEVRQSIAANMAWQLANMNEDGGFVFKRNASFMYGDQPIVSAPANQSTMFATWFRLLAIAYGSQYLEQKNNFNFSTLPGYHFAR